MKEQYYGETIARSVMFSNDIDKTLKNLKELLFKMDVDMVEMLEIINETFFTYADAGFLSGNGKTNIYMYLHFISREVELSEDAKSVYKFYYQVLIDMLNNDVTDKSMDDFYRMELAIRKSAPKYYNHTMVSSSKISEMTNKVNASIESDLNVLYSHLDLPERDYLGRQISYISSPTFMDSARYLLYEYPGLVSEKRFKSRLCSTLETKEMFNKIYRKNVFRRLSLDKDKAYLGQIRFSRDDKKLYKQVVGM